MNVKEIIEKHLVNLGYDGLYADGSTAAGKCACELESLMICASYASLECSPGYYQPVPKGSKGFLIGPERPVAVHLNVSNDCLDKTKAAIVEAVKVAAIDHLVQAGADTEEHY